MNDLAAKHKHEMATEKEKAIQVKYIISRVHVEKKIKYIQALKMFELNTCIFFPFDFQMQSSYQQRQERERKDMEQAHMKIVKQMESRLYEMEGVNKVLCVGLGVNLQSMKMSCLRIWAVVIVIMCSYIHIPVPMVHFYTSLYRCRSSRTSASVLTIFLKNMFIQ